MNEEKSMFKHSQSDYELWEKENGRVFKDGVEVNNEPSPPFKNRQQRRKETQEIDRQIRRRKREIQRLVKREEKQILARMVEYIRMNTEEQGNE